MIYKTKPSHKIYSLEKMKATPKAFKTHLPAFFCLWTMVFSSLHICGEVANQLPLLSNNQSHLQALSQALVPVHFHPTHAQTILWSGLLNVAKPPRHFYVHLPILPSSLPQISAWRTLTLKDTLQFWKASDSILQSICDLYLGWHWTESSSTWTC